MSSLSFRLWLNILSWFYLNSLEITISLLLNRLELLKHHHLTLRRPTIFLLYSEYIDLNLCRLKMVPGPSILRRTGKFTPLDEIRCNHYARFMKSLSRTQADIIFWVLFILVICLLAISSNMYTKASSLPKIPVDIESAQPNEKSEVLSQHAQSCRRVRKRCFGVSIFSVFLSLIFIVMEALAALSIEFCDGEDLIFFYWSFWTLISVGSVIAIVGIALNQWYTLRSMEHPPWNVALGTPVLVVAAITHLWHITARKLWRRMMKIEEKEAENDQSNSFSER
jgi:hypothetical protein